MVAQTTNVHLELSDLSAEALVKVVGLLNDLGDSVLSYSIITSETKFRPKTGYRKFEAGETPYSAEAASESLTPPIEVSEQYATPLDIEPKVTNIPLVNDSKSESDDLKSNLKKYL